MGQAFFCENCGTRVDSRADKCPGCGRIFQAVKCPRCSTTGSPEDFRSGCPSCGYLASRSKPDPAASGRSQPLHSRRELSTPVTVALIALLLIILAGLIWLLVSG